MSERVCKVEGCNSSYEMRCGYCNKHYLRYKRYGDPLAGASFRKKYNLNKNRPEYNSWNSMKYRCYNKKKSRLSQLWREGDNNRFILARS